MLARVTAPAKNSASPGVNATLLVAALAGLLASTSACSSDDSSSSSGSPSGDGAPHITSSTLVEGMDAAAFQALCDERHGTVEVMAHCGGLATAKGVSYDTETQLLSEHTCKGANTCGGWNCIIE